MAEMIEGDIWYLPQEVAALTGRGVGAVYNLMDDGNQLGKLPFRTFLGRRAIKKADLHDFVFVSSGRYGKMKAYRFDEAFKMQYVAGVSVSPRMFPIPAVEADASPV